MRVAVLVTEAFKRPVDLISSGEDGQRLASQVALVVKNLPAKAGDKKCGFDVFLVQEYPLEEEMASHSSILAWRIPWVEELGGLQSRGHKELDMTEVT